MVGTQLGYVHARLLGSVGHTFGVERLGVDALYHQSTLIREGFWHHPLKPVPGRE